MVLCRVMAQLFPLARDTILNISKEKREKEKKPGASMSIVSTRKWLPSSAEMKVAFKWECQGRTGEEKSKGQKGMGWSDCFYDTVELEPFCRWRGNNLGVCYTVLHGSKDQGLTPYPQCLGAGFKHTGVYSSPRIWAGHL